MTLILSLLFFQLELVVFTITESVCVKSQYFVDGRF
jgi:hypothetical protein